MGTRDSSLAKADSSWRCFYIKTKVGLALSHVMTGFSIAWRVVDLSLNFATLAGRKA